MPLSWCGWCFHWVSFSCAFALFWLGVDFVCGGCLFCVGFGWSVRLCGGRLLLVYLLLLVFCLLSVCCCRCFGVLFGVGVLVVSFAGVFVGVCVERLLFLVFVVGPVMAWFLFHSFILLVGMYRCCGLLLVGVVWCGCWYVGVVWCVLVRGCVLVRELRGFGVGCVGT